MRFRLVDGCFRQRTSTNINGHPQLHRPDLQLTLEYSLPALHMVAEAVPIHLLLLDHLLPLLLLLDLLRSV